MREALFMGRLTAQATHEMQNILATIRETAGLMDDLLAMGGGEFAHAERFKKGLGVVAQQVERGMELSEQLNYCAHSPEPSPAGCEVNDALRSLCVLYTRIAAGRRVLLGFVPGRSGLRTDLRGVEVMGLAALALDCALPLLQRDADLRLIARESGGLPDVLVSCASYDDLCRRTEFLPLADRARSLGAGLRAGPDGQGLAISLPLARG